MWPGFGFISRAGPGSPFAHPFVDGNKRSAFLAVGLFLTLNGYRLVSTQAEATLTMLALAAGDIDEATSPAGFASIHEDADQRLSGLANAP
jgi:death-on-curing protein